VVDFPAHILVGVVGRVHGVGPFGVAVAGQAFKESSSMGRTEWIMSAP
jgi:hypothetical protein